MFMDASAKAFAVEAFFASWKENRLHWLYLFHLKRRAHHSPFIDVHGVLQVENGAADARKYLPTTRLTYIN